MEKTHVVIYSPSLIPHTEYYSTTMGLSGMLEFINTKLQTWGGCAYKRTPSSVSVGEKTASVIDVMVAMHQLAHCREPSSLMRPVDVFRGVVLKMLTMRSVQEADVVVFAADIQTKVTKLKAAERKKRDAKSNELGCYGPDDVHYFTDDGIESGSNAQAFHLQKLLRSRAHLGTFFQYLSDATLAYTKTCSTSRTRLVIWDFHEAGYHLIDTAHGTRKTVHRPSDTAVGEGEQMLCLWANVLTRKQFSVTCLTSDTDFLPLSLSLAHAQEHQRVNRVFLVLADDTPQESGNGVSVDDVAVDPLVRARGGRDLETLGSTSSTKLGRLVWQRWPFRGKPSPLKPSVIDIRILAKNLEKKMGLDAFLLLCVLGGNDFVDRAARQAYLPRTNLATLICDRWPAGYSTALRATASNILRRPSENEALDLLDRYIAMLGIQRRKHVAPAPNYRTERLARGKIVRGVLVYWFLDWNAHGSLGWHLPCALLGDVSRRRVDDNVVSERDLSLDLSA